MTVFRCSVPGIPDGDLVDLDILYSLYLRLIDVEVKDSEVILSGEVSEKYARRLAEDLAESVTGVSNVQNRIHVTGAGRKHS